MRLREKIHIRLKVECVNDATAMQSTIEQLHKNIRKYIEFTRFYVQRDGARGKALKMHL